MLTLIAPGLRTCLLRAVYQRRRAAWPGRHYCPYAVRVPALGVPHRVPCTVAPQVCMKFKIFVCSDCKSAHQVGVTS